MSSTQWGMTATVWAERPVSGDKWAGGAAGDGVVCSGWATAFREKGKPIRVKQLTSAFQERRAAGHAAGCTALRAAPGTKGRPRASD